VKVGTHGSSVGIKRVGGTDFNSAGICVVDGNEVEDVVEGNTVASSVVDEIVDVSVGSTDGVRNVGAVVSEVVKIAVDESVGVIVNKLRITVGVAEFAADGVAVDAVGITVDASEIAGDMDGSLVSTSEGKNIDGDLDVSIIDVLDRVVVDIAVGALDIVGNIDKKTVGTSVETSDGYNVDVTITGESDGVNVDAVGITVDASDIVGDIN
jgi:hypothetical protein